MTIFSFAAAAAIFALGVAGCKYSAPAGSLPGPSPAPTLGPGIVAEEPVPTAGATPLGIVTGPDGNVWFTEFVGNKIGRVVPGTFPAAGSITECPINNTPASQPIDVTSVPGNPNVWFDEFGGNKIAFVTPSTCAITEFTVPTNTSGPIGLTSDQSGLLWFAESQPSAPKITKMTTGGIMTEYPIPISGSRPNAVTIASDNTVWYIDFGTNAIGHLTFPGGTPTFAEYGIPTNPSNPEYITLGPDSNLWFTEVGPVPVSGCQIGKVTLGATPTITEYQLVFPQPSPDGDFCLGITSAGGYLWFAEANAGAIGRITPTGVVTEYGIPGNGTTALDVTRGPDGNVWFTDGAFDANVTGVGTNQIGRVNISLIPASSTRRSYKAHATTHRLSQIPIHGIYLHHH